MLGRIVGISLAVLLAGLVGWRISTVRAANATVEVKKDDRALVRTTRVARVDLAEEAALTGTVRPRNEVDVFAKTGGRLESLSAQVGDRVRQGQELASVEHKEIGWQAKAAEAQLLAAQAQRDVARAGLAGARLELGNTTRLAEGGAAPQAALDGANVKLQLAEAQVAAAEAGVAQASAAAGLARQMVANARIEAPISGTVTRRLANLGGTVGQQLPVFTVQDVATLKLETSVDALTYSRLARGRPVEITVDAFPGETYRGKIDVLSPSLDAVSRRANVEVLIDNAAGKLLPNMFARASVAVGQFPKVLAVPVDAVLNAPGGAVVFRVRGEKVERVKPQLGPSSGGLVAVLGGLDEGDEVVLTGLGALSDGQGVRVAVSLSQAK